MAKMSVIFAYGASGGGGGDHRRGIEKHLGYPIETLDWRAQDPHFNVPPEMQGYMTGRFNKIPEDLGDPNAGEAALGPPEWAWKHFPPDWRRGLLRQAYGGVTTSWTTIADAINYLHNGMRHVEAVAPLIDEWSARTPGPHVAIGLSLGGLVLADALAWMGRDGKKVPVDLLVTAGSQAGIINLSDGMAVIRRTSKEGPAPFHPWLNIWNHDDYLSWPLDGSLPDNAQIWDGVIETKDYSFPECHSQYFQQDATYEHIEKALTRIGN
jgi:hypothetical protein